MTLGDGTIKGFPMLYRYHTTVYSMAPESIHGSDSGEYFDEHESSICIIVYVGVAGKNLGDP
jgi:hypothetical protein